MAAACHDMAVRFHQGGKLVVFGTGASSTDALHVAVEFVHPVIVGKRAPPAISLTADVATVTGIAEREGMGAIFAHQLRHLAVPADIALGLSADGNSESVLNGLLTAHGMGMLTIALVGRGRRGDRHQPGGRPRLASRRNPIPAVVKEVHVTAYHVLWELVHVFFEQPGVLGPASGLMSTQPPERPCSRPASATTRSASPARIRAVAVTDRPAAGRRPGHRGYRRRARKRSASPWSAPGWATPSWCTRARPSRWCRNDRRCRP